MTLKEGGAADSIYVNGKIITVDAKDSVVEALAIKGDKIVAVGSDVDIRELAGTSTEVVDLAGKTVLPGINDSHAHAAMYGSSRPPLTLDLGFPMVKSIADIKEAVRERAAAVKPGEWIRGNGWDYGYLAEYLTDRSRGITRWDLDEVAPHNPVFLVDFSQHRLVANSRALEVAGITRDSTIEPGSEIVKDPDTGEPTGMLVELPAQGLLMRAVPPFNREEKRAAIISVLQTMNARGITSLTDPALGPGGAAMQGGMLGPESIGVYNDLRNEGSLSVRINVLYLFGNYGALSLEDLEESLPTVGERSVLGDEWLKAGGVKLFADGIPQTKTAWMHEEYPDGGNGSLVVPGATEQERHDHLAGMIVFAHRHGFQCGIHAVGDRAIRSCVDGFLKAQEQDSQRLRHYLIHSDMITESDIDRIAANGIGVSAQSILKWVFSDDIDTVLGIERSERQFPLRSLLDAGVHLSLSSDAPVTAPDWLRGVEAAVLRKSKASGTVRGPRQRITVQEAIRAYTMGSAWLDHMEERKGSLERGKLADFCVLDQDILSIPAEDIHAITNVGTVVGGKVVYDAGLRR